MFSTVTFFSSIPDLGHWLFWPTVGFKAFRPSRPNQNIVKLMGVIWKHDLTDKYKEKYKYKDKDNDKYI